MKNIIKKSALLFPVGILVGFVGQIAWAMIFWNNDNLFMQHWTFVGIGISLMLLSIPGLFLTVRELF